MLAMSHVLRWMCSCCSAFNSLLSQSASLPAVPQRLMRQGDLGKDAVLKTVCESVQSALNMPFIGEATLIAQRLNADAEASSAQSTVRHDELLATVADLHACAPTAA